MSRNYAKSRSRIQRMCTINEVKEKDLYEKGKLLLEIYRDVCWSSVSTAYEVRANIMNYGSLDTPHADMEAALVYLEHLAPEEGRERFEEQIRNLFETSWMIDIIDAAMIKVREFPRYGDLYYELLNMCYLNRFVYTESEVLEEMCMERSTYYRRKREAIVVFGFSIWGAPFDEFKQFMRENTEPEFVQMTLL